MMLLRLSKIGLWGLLVFGILLQLWLKDRHLLWTLFFYAMPKPCLALLAAGLAYFSRRRGRITAGLVCLMITAWWLASSYRGGLEIQPAAAARKAADEVTMLYWNLARPVGLDAEMVSLMKAWQPDIAAFVEPGQSVETLLAEYEKQLPGYRAAWMPRGILWLARVPSRYRDRGKLDGIGAYALFYVEGLGSTFPVVVADVHPGYPRKVQLQQVLAHSSGRRDAILVGDFNTPLESIFFADYRARFQNALEVAGTGFKETWPIGLPLLSLDHFWTGPDWQILQAQKIWDLTGSDHAALWVKLKRR
jgi:endonuclease/exonuclease/phosphatase (EEP) superfamily protein YafD